MTGKTLKTLLKQRGMKQRYFADKAKVAEDFLSNFITGRIDLDADDARFIRMVETFNEISKGK